MGDPRSAPASRPGREQVGGGANDGAQSQDGASLRADGRRVGLGPFKSGGASNTRAGVRGSRTGDSYDKLGLRTEVTSAQYGMLRWSGALAM